MIWVRKQEGIQFNQGGFIDFFGYPFCRGRVVKNLENCNKYNTTREVF